MVCHNDRALSGDVALLLEVLVLLREGDLEAAATRAAELTESKNLAMIVLLLCRDLPFNDDLRLYQAQRKILSAFGGRGSHRSTIALPGVARRVACNLIPSPEPPLTIKQMIVLRCVKEGLSNLDAATRLGVSINTVKWHLKELFRVLEVSNRLALVNKAESRGLI